MTAESPRKQNLFIGDNFFKQNPSKVLGEQTIVKGRFGSDMIKVKGSIDAINKIDVPAAQIVDLFPEQEFAVENKEEIIQKVFQAEAEKETKAKVLRLRTGKKEVVNVADKAMQELYSYEEVHKMYNQNISEEELQAYFFTHPELDYKLLFDEYTLTEEEMIEKGLICWEADQLLSDAKLVYVYTYQSGNIAEKLSQLERWKGALIDKYGEKQYLRQKTMLEAVRPKQKGLVGEERIILLPHSNFAKKFKIGEVRHGAPELHAEYSLFDVFKQWLRIIPADNFDKSNYREVIDYYLDNKNIEINDRLSKAEKEKQEKAAINTKQRSKEEGDRLFAKFLEEEVMPEDQARLAFMWNEKFNSIAEPNLTKIPVVFKVSKTFKSNLPFQLNPTQRHGVAFTQEKGCGLFAYGVGVGKTATSIAAFSQAYENKLANKALFVVPTNTYDKWLGEIGGYTDKETGKFLHGILPQHNLVGVYNLNPIIVKEKLKEYSKEDNRKFAQVESAINLCYKVKGAEFKEKEEDALLSIMPQLNLFSIKVAYKEEYLATTKSAKPKTIVEYTIEYLKKEYDYLVYELGTFKSFPRGTIFVTTEVGLQRLGVSEENQLDLRDQLYEILSQGEKSGESEDNRDIAKLQEKIEQRMSSSLKNAKLHLEDFGVDWACFDEAHYYKKLFTFVKGAIKEEDDRNYYSRGKKSNREKSKYELKSGAFPSSRALSAFVVSHFIQKKTGYRNVIQLTATPFTNSPLEVFSMLTLTNYGALEKMGLSNMVDFFDTFMRINWDIKYTPQKTVVKDVVLTGYNNLSQLRQIIYSLMDKKDEGANLKRPTKHVWPSMQHGIETTLPMTSEQNELMATVKKYINGDDDLNDVCGEAVQDEVEGADFDSLDDEALIGMWESVTGKEFEGERELSDKRREQLISQIKNQKEQTAEFSEGDLSEEESLGVRILRGLAMMLQITLSPYLYYKACAKANGEKADMPKAEDYIRSSPKLQYVMGCIKSVIDFHISRGEKISGQVIYMNAGVEYFTLIKEYLVRKMHLKDSQVGIVSGGMSKGAKENVKARFLSGDILVLIGSSTIAVGVDLQNNSTVLYNCYYDWNPTDAAQIEGRIWRQGNRFANVRIVYPQCYNSADPVIFEYLNSKTLRINEIWNRSSEVQELDLRDFNPKELQKKLITDPEEKADWEILEETDKITGQIVYFENRRESLQKAVRAREGYKQLKPKAINWLNTVINAELDFKRKEALAQQAKKIEEITEKYEGDDEKIMAEIKKYKTERYDYKNDPEGKFTHVDYNSMDNQQIFEDCKKWSNKIDEWTWRDSERLGELWTKRADIVYDMQQFRLYYKDMNAAERQILAPMGLSFDTAMNPVDDLNKKIEDLKTDLDAINSSRDQRIEKFRIEMLAEATTLKTVEDRVNEFASYNEALLPPQLVYEQAKPVELPKPAREEANNPVADQKLKQEFLKDKDAILEAMRDMAAKSKNFENFLTVVRSLASNWNINLNSEEFYQAMGLKHGDKEFNKKVFENFYKEQGIPEKKARKQSQKDAIASSNVDKIMGLAASAENEMQEQIAIDPNAKPFEWNKHTLSEALQATNSFEATHKFEIPGKQHNLIVNKGNYVITVNGRPEYVGMGSVTREQVEDWVKEMHKKIVKNNLGLSKTYQKYIASGEMTPERAIEIIKSAGLPVPDDILLSKPAEGKESPMEKLYKKLHAHYDEKFPNIVLWFQIPNSDFIEAYFEDAQKTADTLGTVLATGKNGEKLAGFPRHSLDNYLHKMVKAGYRVALVDNEKYDGEIVERKPNIKTSEPVEVPKPTVAPAAQISAAERKIKIEKQIKALNIAAKFADTTTKEKIGKQVKALEIALKFT